MPSKLCHTKLAAESFIVKLLQFFFESRLCIPMWLGGVEVAMLLHKSICLLFNYNPIELDLWPSLLFARFSG